MKCSIAGCGQCQSNNRPNLTFHRLPRKESRQREWLEKIGLENIRPGTKNIHVCSLHFEESAFNKTLSKVRLRDDAIPTLFTKADHPPHFALIDRANTIDQPSCSGYSHSQDAKDLELASALQELKKLEEKVEKQKKKIKCLNEVIRQQKLKLDTFKNIITELKEKNLINMETSILLRQCAGSKDFLQRQILKFKGLPLPKQYSEEIRKFALTLHFYSPKAYDFVRRTYESCLPHPRTLSKWYQNVDAAPGLWSVKRPNCVNRVFSKFLSLMGSILIIV